MYVYCLNTNGCNKIPVGIDDKAYNTWTNTSLAGLWLGFWGGSRFRKSI